jgi:hypothetical protein
MVEGQLMGYKAMIHRNVNKAFRAVGDIADEVELKKKSSAEFNFGTVSAKIKEAPSIFTTIIVTEIVKPGGARNPNRMLALFQVHEIGDINAYETVILEDELTKTKKEWKIGPVIESNRFVAIAEICKET